MCVWVIDKVILIDNHPNNSDCRDSKQAIILPGLRKFFKKGEMKIKLKPGDWLFELAPNQTQEWL